VSTTPQGAGGGGAGGSDAGPVIACGTLPPIEIAAVVQPTGSNDTTGLPQVEVNLSGQVTMLGVGQPPNFCAGVVGGSWSWLELEDTTSTMNWTLCVSVPGVTLPFKVGDGISVVAHVTKAMYPPDSVTLTVKKGGAFVAYYADVHTPPSLPFTDLPSGLAIASGAPICHEPNFGNCTVDQFYLDVTDANAVTALAPGQSGAAGVYSVTVGRNDRYTDTMGSCTAGDLRFTFTVVPK
jgi:hypothetical protein